MKAYAIKVLSQDKIIILHTRSNPIEIAKISYPDIISSGSGTPEDPYIYSSNLELIGEIPKSEDGSYILPNSNFRDSWDSDGEGGIKVNLSKAKAEKMVKIRSERDKRLLETDAKWIEEASKGNSTVDIETEKQILRDIPDTAEAALDLMNDEDSIENYNAFE